MSARIDWAGLVRAGLHGLGLEPAAFWRLTPVELRIMLGAEPMVRPLNRARLSELAAAFPDMRKDAGDGGNRRSGGTAGGAGGTAGDIGGDGGRL